MAVRTPITINICSIPVKGAGGLGMLGMVLLIAAAIPVARWLLVGSVIAGAIAAVLVIRRKRDYTIGSPMNGLPMSLGLSAEREPRRERSQNGSGHLLPRFATS
jgi:hypothetical protein